jgi:hypothetical protein
MVDIDIDGLKMRTLGPKSGAGPGGFEPAPQPGLVVQLGAHDVPPPLLPLPPPLLLPLPLPPPLLLLLLLLLPLPLLLPPLFGKIQS